MRSDFNKLLTEAPRLRNHWKFSDVRNAKGNDFDEEAKGGKVSIHALRRNTTVPRRAFNENLNTLKRFIKSQVGRPWNKVYSEICENFDKRKVVNDHILVHLFEYVEINAQMHDGRVCVLNSYRHGSYDYVWDPVAHKSTRVPNENYYDKRWTPIKDDSCLWYVHPVDGLLKENKGHKTRRQAKKLESADWAKKKAKVFRQLNTFEELHFEDGVWYHYTMKAKPAPRQVFGIPGYSEHYFAALSDAEKKAKGEWYLKDVKFAEVYPKKDYGDRRARGNLYYATRELANKKVLKSQDLIGTATFNEEGSISHRTLNKNRFTA